MYANADEATRLWLIKTCPSPLNGGLECQVQLAKNQTSDSRPFSASAYICKIYSA